MDMTKRGFARHVAAMTATIAAAMMVPLPLLRSVEPGQKSLWYREDGIFFRLGRGPWIDITHEEGGFKSRLNPGDRVIIRHWLDEKYDGRVVLLERVFIDVNGIEAFSSRV